MDPVTTGLTGSVMTITLNRPDRLNAITPELMRALSDACAEAGRPEIRAVVLTGAGRGFCAGADIKAPKVDLQPGSRRHRQLYNPAIVELASLPKPVIAAVNGPAVGAGVSLAAAADIRIASDRATFSAGFVDVGLAPDTGASYFLLRLLGYARAFQFLTTGEKLSADQALALGLVNEIVGHDRLTDHALELAARLADKPGIGVPTTKSLLRHAARNSLVEQLEAEATAYDQTSTSEDRLAARAAMVARITSGS